jgi:hypothetical protein
MSAELDDDQAGQGREAITFRRARRTSGRNLAYSTADEVRVGQEPFVEGRYRPPMLCSKVAIFDIERQSLLHLPENPALCTRHFRNSMMPLLLTVSTNRSLVAGITISKCRHAFCSFQIRNANRMIDTS